MPHKKRNYSINQKTTTKEGKRDYQRAYMRDWRKQRTKKLKALEEENRILRKIAKEKGLEI